MKYLFVFLTGLFLSPAYGQLDVVPSAESHLVLPATLSTVAIPGGATFQGGWEVSPGISFLKHDDRTIHWTATEGEHTIAYVGYWISTEEVTFKDGDGNEITIQSFKGSGMINESATVTVTGGTDPDPPPDPDQPVSGKKHLVIFHQAESLDRMPPAQRYLINSLQMRKNLIARGHRLIQVIDDDQLESPTPGKWKPWIDAVRGDPLPRVAIASAEGGPVTDYPLPVDYKSLLRLLGEQ